MKKNWFFTWGLCVCFYMPLKSFSVLDPRPSSENTLVLSVGESVRVKTKPFESTYLSQSGLISLRDEGFALVLQARKQGQALLRVGKKVYKIQVVPFHIKDHFQKIKNFLKTKKGLKASLDSSVIFVTGRLHRIRDYKDLAEFSKIHKLVYQFEAYVQPHQQAPLTSYIKNQMQPLLPPSMYHILWNPSLQALLPSSHLLNETVETLLANHGLKVVKDRTFLPRPPLVELKLVLVETSLNTSLKINVPLNPGSEEGEGHFITRILDKSFFQKWLKEFKSLESRGQGHILARATLLSESGKNSRFLSGGEVPIPHFHSETGKASIQWKPYGIRLNFKARADRKNSIHLKLQAEISEVSHAFSASQAPSLKTNRLNSDLTLKAGQTLALMGIVRLARGKDLSAPWPLSKLPVLGSALSFKGKLKDQTRLSVFVTTRIVEDV